MGFAPAPHQHRVRLEEDACSCCTGYRSASQILLFASAHPQVVRVWSQSGRACHAPCATLAVITESVVHGFGSAGAAELRGDLERPTGLDLPPTLAFDYPTSAEMAAMLAARMSAAASAGAEEAPAPGDRFPPMQPAPPLPDVEVQSGVRACHDCTSWSVPSLYQQR